MIDDIKLEELNEAIDNIEILLRQSGEPALQLLDKKKKIQKFEENYYSANENYYADNKPKQPSEQEKLIIRTIINGINDKIRQLKK